MTARPPLLLGGPDGALRWLLEQWEGDRRSLEIVAERLRGPHRASVLTELAATRAVDPATLAAAARRTWALTERISDADWRAWEVLFRRIGPSVDSTPGLRPAQPIRLYRGANASRRHHVRWTTELGTASLFARYCHGQDDEPGEVWAADVEPWRIYAVIVDRPELHDAEAQHEYVIDTRALAMQATAPAAVLPVGLTVRRDLRRAADILRDTFSTFSTSFGGDAR